MKQIIDVLQKVTIKKSVFGNIKKLFSPKQKNIESEYKEGEIKLILVEMPDGNNYTIKIEHSGRYHQMYIKLKNDTAIEETFKNVETAESIEKLFGIKIQIEENGKWTDLTKKASQYYADKIRIGYGKSFKTNTKVSLVDSTVVKYTPLKTDVDNVLLDENIESIQNITNTSQRRVIHLEDFDSNIEDFKKQIIQSINNHELLAIYPLKHAINSGELSTSELFAQYNFVLNRLNDFSRRISDILITDYGFETSTNYFINEILKNSFIHGNKLKTNLPVYMDFSGRQIRIYNNVNSQLTSTDRERFVFSSTGGSGFKTGIKVMQAGQRAEDEKAKLAQILMLSGYFDNVDMLNYSSNPEVTKKGKTFYEAVINIDASQPSFTDVAKTSENMLPYEHMAESSNKADLSEEIFNDLIGFAYFKNAVGKTEEEIHKFHNGIIVKEVNNYFNTLSLEQRKKYIDKNKEKTKELFNEDKSKIAKEIENKIMTSREGLEQFIRSKGYDADKGHIQEIISDITSKGLFLNPEEIIKRVQAGEENSLRFTLLQNTVGITGINDELAEFVFANAGLTLEEFKEKAEKEYGTIKDKSWNLELKKYEQKNSLSGENKLTPG